MKRLILTLAILASSILISPAAAQAEFGFEALDVTFTNEDGSPAAQAGSHPYALTTAIDFNYHAGGVAGIYEYEPDDGIKDLTVAQVEGLIGAPAAMPTCSTVDFLTHRPQPEPVAVECADSTALGTSSNYIIKPPGISGGPAAVPFNGPVYNLDPPPGVAARFGLYVGPLPVMLELALSESRPYNVVARLRNIPYVLPLYASRLTVWGTPGNPAHDGDRGACFFYDGTCPASLANRPYLTLPRACKGPLATRFEADSWQNPGAFLPNGEADLSDPNWILDSVLNHDGSEPPDPLGFLGCGKLPFNPSITAQPTTKAATSPTGLDFALDVNDEGLINTNGLANSDIEKAVVTLPEGMSANPSLAEGLVVCSEADLARETAKSLPGEGCPDASKIGSVEVETPLVNEKVDGALYIAKPYENPFGSLLAMYLVLQNRTLGISVKQPLKIESDPVTGQLTTVAEDLPQLPFSHFKLHFREGARSPLASPPVCGTYDGHDPAHEPVKALLYPSSGTPPMTTTSAFQIVSGPDAGPCPTGGLPPFHPGLIAGTLNNAAGRFSPFNVRLSRSDSEQEISHFSIKLPPGIVGKLAGIPFCPDAAIAAAKARSGPHGGQEELDSPSCPAASEVGRTLAGAGVGPSLAYAPGKVYLAGPYHGSAISFVSITAGKVGPFDIGTVVVRLALRVNPETGEIFIDATGSDPIPHIVKGIPVRLRDIRAYTDRPEFVLNPTGCMRTSTASTLLGSGLDFGSEADDRPVTVSTPFQAADCAALPFRPKLSFRLVGGIKRGAHPALRAHLKMNGIGEAAIAHAQVTLPRSEFIENAHFNTICTRVQFKAGAGNGEQCPAGSVYGHAKAVTPILSDPLEGPVFLRSSEHQLPDVVAALHNGEIDVHLVGRVDSVKGQLRNTFEVVPDAPVSSFDLTLAGQKKGLFVNSTDLCKATHRAEASFTGHNGKTYESRPVLRVKCPKAHKKTRRHKRRAR
jgi:hypothetical protein